MTTARRSITALAAAVVVSGLLALSHPAARTDGATTLERTILDLNGDGRLEYAAGEPLMVRQDLGTNALAGRDVRRSTLLSLVGFTDFQLADEESAVRAPWADKCTNNNPFESAIRPQEAMVPHLINSNIRAATELGGGPVTGRPFDFGIQLGDAADNTQRNEVRWFIDLLDGGRLVDPDSGNREKYEGPQGADPWPAQGGRSILELANDPFFAPGLRHPDGTPIPWYSVLGNHDAKVQGTPPNLPGWWEFIRVYSQGPVYVRDLAPDYQQQLCADPALVGDPAFWMKVLARPGTTTLVTADPARVNLTRLQWMAEHLPPPEAHKVDPDARGSTGVPAGHGFLGDRCTNADGKLLDRLCYSFDRQGIHFIVLDTNPDEGLAQGNIDAGQFAWFERELIAHSSRFYDAGGALKQNTLAENQLIVVFTHHTRDTIDEEDFPVHLKTTDHPATERIDSEARMFAADFEAMMLRFPNVILHGAGHTHENRIWARPGRKPVPVQNLPGTGYWEVSSSSHADWPHQSRTIEFVDNRDGTLSIFGVIFDATAPAKACRGDETGAAAASCLKWDDDATHEKGHGAPRDVNEEYLASVGREVGYNDPQAGKTDDEARGRNPGDRNVEMIVANPLGLVAVSPTKIPRSVPGAGALPPTGLEGTRGSASSPALGAPARTVSPDGVGAPASRDTLWIGTIRGLALVGLALATLVWLLRARVRGRMLRASGP